MKEEQLLNEYKDLIYYCMHHCRISMTSPDKDDYYQIGQLVLLDAAKNSQENPLSQEIGERKSFAAYASQRIIWRMQDYQRQLNHYYNYYQATEDQYLDQADDHGLDQEVLAQDLIHQLQNRLNDQEMTLCLALLDPELNHSQRAQKLGISRKTYYRRWKLLKEKLKDLKNG